MNQPLNPRSFDKQRAANVNVYGRFATVIGPWIAQGANMLPILPGSKQPAVSGWGQAGPGPALHRPDSPRIPVETYSVWAEDYRNYNAALLPASIDLMVLDVDDPSKVDTVIEAVGETPYRVESGREGGGTHLFYKGATRSRNAIAPGVDLKSTGGYVIAFGSIHASGREYRASPEMERGLATGTFSPPRPRPGWAQRLAAIRNRITNPSRLDLAQLADRLRAKDAHRTGGRILRAIADGRTFAEPGERDTAIYQMLRDYIAREWPHATEDAILSLFAPSIDAMLKLDPDSPGLDIVREKWTRIVGERRNAEDAAEERQRVLRQRAHQWVGRREYDAVEDPSRPIVLHHGKGYYVRIGEDYAGPWTRDEFTPDVLQTLAAVYQTPFKDFAELLARHGTRPARVRNSVAVQRTAFDETSGVLTVALAPVRSDLVPERSAAVEQIITEIGGVYAGHLILWLAGLLRGELPCRALVLSGEGGVGKSLFLDGVGRIWPHGAAKMRDVLGRQFNSRLAESALVVADDDTAPAASGEALASFLREAVHDRVQRLERKHHDVTTVEGCMRYAIGTNDPFALIQGAVSYKLNQESLEAFGDRLLHIPVPASARGCWDRAGVTGTELVEGDMIARHVLWLAEQHRDLEPMERFWVPAADEDLARLAVISNGLRGDILVRIFEALNGTGTPEWLAVYDGYVLVYAGRMFETWVLDRPRNATRRVVGQACAALAKSSRSQHPYTGGPRFHVIDRDLVDWYAEKSGMG